MSTSQYLESLCSRYLDVPCYGDERSDCAITHSSTLRATFFWHGIAYDDQKQVPLHSALGRNTIIVMMSSSSIISRSIAQLVITFQTIMQYLSLKDSPLSLSLSLWEWYAVRNEWNVPHLSISIRLASNFTQPTAPYSIYHIPRLLTITLWMYKSAGVMAQLLVYKAIFIITAALPLTAG